MFALIRMQIQRYLPQDISRSFLRRGKSKSRELAPNYCFEQFLRPNVKMITKKW